MKPESLERTRSRIILRASLRKGGRGGDQDSPTPRQRGDRVNLSQCGNGRSRLGGMGHSTEIRCLRWVRFAPNIDRSADISQRRFGADISHRKNAASIFAGGTIAKRSQTGRLERDILSSIAASNRCRARKIQKSAHPFNRPRGLVWTTS